MKRRLIISDIDGILREDKKPIEPVLVESLLDITKNVLLVCITGAPLHHVPEVLFDCSWMIFAEMGGVKWKKGRVEIHSQKQKYIQEIKEVLGIASDKEDGEVETYLGKVILEGPRKTSLTFLIGEPEHYQGQKGSLYFEDLQTFLKFVIDVKKLPLKISVGADKKYQWIDVISCTKKETIEKAQNQKYQK
ncbi:MAG TPA: hypothetical protein EYP36_06660 [Calditrichaeota bacterium]|nr:hypothetical protein [Calditrichota bacterium]